MSLCKPCSQINTQHGSSHHNYDDLRKSAQEGCPCCQLILNETGGNVDQVKGESAGASAGEEGDTKARGSEIFLDLTNSGISYKIYDCEGGQKDLVFFFQFVRKRKTNNPLAYSNKRRLLLNYLFLAKNNSLAKIEKVFCRDLADHSGSDDCFRAILSWIKMCLEHHPDCHQNETLLPTHVLDVSGSDPILVNGERINDNYVALSHCWGLEPAITTTLATLHERQRKIPKSSMPASFRDAVIISKRLGVKYLWIDSLCIVQDSTDDWRTESAKMQDYYRNAYLTISALESPNSYHGILNARKKKLVQLTSEVNLYLRSQLWRQDDVFREVVLNIRAWTLQERLLSTRVVHYSKDELLWECSTCSGREGSMQQQTGRIDPGTVIFSEGGDFKRTLSLLKRASDNPKADAMTTWYRLVTQYSRRALTKPNDRLPAIAGIAAAIQEISKYTYLAGVWKEDIRSLLWSKRDKRPRGPSPYLAPSWSWAASTSPIAMRFGNKEQPIVIAASLQAEILYGQIENIGTDCYSGVRNGSIIIEAPTLNIEYHQFRYRYAGRVDLGFAVSLVESGIVELSLSRDIGFGTGYLDVIDEDLIVTDDSFADPVYTATIEHGTENIPRHSPRGDVVLYISKAKIKKCVAIWIAEGLGREISLLHEGFLNNDRVQSHGGTLYCLLVVEDAVQPGKWRRIGVGKSVHHYGKEIEWSEERCMCLI